ncbi:MAG: RagB/SusD family nutrient uptake outer membrane protein [Bacteroides xylanisolvens]
MKKVIIILSFVMGLGSVLVGCSDYLDSDYIFNERTTIEDVFHSRDYTNQWLAEAYSYLGHDYLQQICSKKSVPFNFADDMYYGDFGYADWKSGKYTEDGTTNKQSLYIWEAAYKGIRQAAVFINNIDMNDQFSAAEITDMKGQAHFLRAYYYWMLIRSFGPVPIMPDEGEDYMKEYDEISHMRNSYDECADYISNELVKAATMLNDDRDMQNIARPTRGAALALRSRVLLYAASPLFNGGAPEEVITALVDKNGRQLLSSVKDNYKWAKAAAAAKDVIELRKYSLHVSYAKDGTDMAYPKTITPPDDNGTFHSNPWPDGWQNIDPFESYRSLFNGEYAAYNNNEIIYTRGANQGGENIRVMVIHQLPRSQGGGYNCHGMTQKQCDAYYMKDGNDCAGMNDMYQGRPGYTDPSRYNIDPRPSEVVEKKDLATYPELGAQGTGVSKQYAGREPRFYASVGYNGSTWHMLNADASKNEKTNAQIFYYRDHSDGYKTGSFWLNTGIGIKKFVHPNDLAAADKAYAVDRVEPKVAPDIRYAEVLLNYAEALNEVVGSHEVPSWNGEKMYTITRTPEDLKEGIQPIRIRAGLPDYDVYDNPDKFRIKVKRERQIELFAEGHRYFDLRRWCDAPLEESLPVYGCNIYVASSNPKGFHTPVETPSLPSIFTTKMWFWPIHYYVMKRNVLMTQNPGWTYPE